MHPDPYPNTEDALRLFLKNAVDHIDKAEVLMEVPKGTFAPMKEACQALLDAFDERDNTRTAAATAEAKLKIRAKLTSTTARAGIQQIKKSPTVTIEVLDLLQLNTPDIDPQARVDAQTPLLKTKMDGIHPTVGCLKHGYDAIEISSCRGGETEFTHLATVTHLPYFDNRPNLDPALPEERHYKGSYLNKNVVVSAEGPVVTLLVPKGGHV